MGVPLLLIGASAGGLLPKAGGLDDRSTQPAWGCDACCGSLYVWPVLLNVVTQPVTNLFGLQAASHLPFQRVKSVAELDAAIANANGKTAVLDFYADWCTSCKEMEN